MNRIVNALKELAGSKKFQAAVLSAIVWGIGKLGLQLTTEQVAPLVAPLWLYIAGQSIADAGKSAAQVQSAATTLVLAPIPGPKPAAAPPAAPAASSPPPAGAAVLAVMFVFGAIGLAALGGAACNASTTAAIENGLWQCTAPERAQAVDALTPLATSAILAAASADGKLIDDAKLEAALSKANLQSDAGALILCAAATAVADLLAPAAPKAGAPAAASFQLDPGAVHAAFEHVRAEHAPGVRFHTTKGDV